MSGPTSTHVSPVSRRVLLNDAAPGGVRLLDAACAERSDLLSPTSTTTLTPTTAPLPAADATSGQGSFALFSQSDLDFQTLLPLGAAGQDAEVDEVVTVRPGQRDPRWGDLPERLRRDACDGQRRRGASGRGS